MLNKTPRSILSPKRSKVIHQTKIVFSSYGNWNLTSSTGKELFHNQKIGQSKQATSMNSWLSFRTNYKVWSSLDMTQDQSFKDCYARLVILSFLSLQKTLRLSLSQKETTTYPTKKWSTLKVAGLTFCPKKLARRLTLSMSSARPLMKRTKLLQPRVTKSTLLHLAT